ncbi:hypothetical protein [Luteimonas sp. MC1828]|uniref:hypothetical protein n=1 Tax=Luteimonas sp. MC1828 TaxID=2799787 RepID=UPI0018F1AB4D|nr:hypothetical protein [Luteimonas sp. MC1828]MBJ7574531.1 hypothetical protein [Luteimonas sp. MC1828]
MDEVIDIPGFGYGILTPARRRATPVTLVLLNAGLTHRVGPFRSYVAIARYLATRSVDVFRFDLPRVGDGPAAGVSVNAMVAAALDALEREVGSRRFVIGGICSAADMAWHIAQHDPRIAGVWLLDGFAHRGRWFRLARVRKALRRPPWQWPGLAWRLLRGLRPEEGVYAADIAVIRDWPEPKAFRRQSTDLLSRGVRILAMYTGGVSKYMLDRRQLDDTFGKSCRHAGLTTTYWPAFDHTLMSPADRDHVLSSLGDWCEQFTRPAAAP